MLVQQKIGNISSFKLEERMPDELELEWHETNKRILHKRTASGKQITIRSLNENPDLTEGDIMYADDESIIIITIMPCRVIVIRPSSMEQMAAVCYEIGNKHLPLFYQDDELLVPFEAPLFRVLVAAGYDAEEGERKLLGRLRSTVAPHQHTYNSNGSLFSKILKLTTPDE